MKELRMTEVMVIIAVMKWCWARLPGGVVTWEVYQAFKIGEKGESVSIPRTFGADRVKSLATLETLSVPSFLSASNPKLVFKSSTTTLTSLLH